MPAIGAHVSTPVRVVERGASSVEYGAVVVLVGAIITAVLGAGIPGEVSGLVSEAIVCVESPSDCDLGDGDGDGLETARGTKTDTEDHLETVLEDETENGPETLRDDETVPAPDLPDPREPEKTGPADRCIQAGSEPYCNPTYSNPAPPSTPTPWVVYNWWDRMSEAERAAVIREKPDGIRNLDGIPVEVRNTLNREFLDAEIERRLNAEGLTREELVTGGGEVGSQELRALVDLQKSMKNGRGSPGDVRYDGDEYFLIALDPEEERAIVSHGNPDTADNVSTLVPGTGAEWTKVHNELFRADGLYQAAVAADEEAEHASITWIGYDTPSALEAPSATLAKNARQELLDFQNGLRLTGTEKANLTVVGHSYGSTVIGHATGENYSLNADNLVFVGSPGVGHDSVGDMRFDGEVYATRSDDDWIDIVPDWIHGPDPMSDEFGAHTFSSDDGTEHPEYFDDPQSSQAVYMGEIITGQK